MSDPARMAVILISSLAAAGCAPEPEHQPQAPRGDAKRGKAELIAFECNACHQIPGVGGPQGYVGPTLEGYSANVYVAGKFPNTADVLVRWIRDAPAMAPNTAMPAFDMTEAQAHDIAAYLYSLR